MCLVPGLEAAAGFGQAMGRAHSATQLWKPWSTSLSSHLRPVSSPYNLLEKAPPVLVTRQISSYASCPGPNIYTPRKAGSENETSD